MVHVESSTQGKDSVRMQAMETQDSEESVTKPVFC